MSLRAALSAFAHRSARPAAAARLVAWSAAFAVGLLAIAAWVVAQADDPHVGHGFHDGASVVDWTILGVADLLSVGVLALGLLVVAPAAVAAAVIGERRAGTLDQLRTTPLSPLALLAGLVAGAPYRVYLLLCGPLALHVACALLGAVPLSTLVTTTCVLGAGGLASMMIAAALALAPPREGGAALVPLAVAGLLAVAGVVAAVLAGDHNVVGWAFLHPGGGIEAALLEHDGIWRRFIVNEWNLGVFDDPAYVGALALAPLESCVASLLLAAVVARAACRKLSRPDLPLLSKHQALLLFGGISSGLLLPLALRSDAIHRATSITLIVAFQLVPVLGLLIAYTTPSAEAWALGVRRATRPRWSDDDAPADLLALLMVALFALAAVAVNAIAGAEHVAVRHLCAFAWLAILATSLPRLLLYLGTRCTTPATRFAFGAVVIAHIFSQLVAIGFVSDRERNFELTYVQACALLAVALPAAVALAQHRLRAHVRAGVA